MTLDMYGEKIAEASALIREFAKVDYFHYFARDPESSLEAFIVMQDSAHAAGRASALAELNPQWLAEKERADRAEAELATLRASAPSQGVAEPVAQNGQGSGCRMTGGICACRSGGSFGGCAKERSYCCTNEPAVPQPAEADKLRKAITTLLSDQKAEAKQRDGDWWRGYESALHWISKEVSALVGQDGGSATKWIACADQMPEQGQLVLIIEKYMEVPCIASHDGNIWNADQAYYDTYASCGPGAILIDKINQEFVTHWAPLPPPPTPEGEQSNG